MHADIPRDITTAVFPPRPISGPTTAASTDCPKPIIAVTEPARVRMSPVAIAVELPMMTPLGEMHSSSARIIQTSPAPDSTAINSSTLPKSARHSPPSMTFLVPNLSMHREFTKLPTHMPTALSAKTAAYPRGLSPNSCWNTNDRSEEHTSELQSRFDLVCRLLLEK